MAGLKSGLFRLGLSALWYTGAAKLLEPFTRGVGTILMMHRVQPSAVHGMFAPNRDLSITPDYLDALIRRLRAARIDMVTLDEAIVRLGQPERQRPFVCFTADDGYRDNFDHAYPVFRRHGVPLTVYVTSGFIDGTMPMWWHVLEMAIVRRERLTVDLGGHKTTFELRDNEAKSRAFATIAAEFFRLAVPGVRALVAAVAEAAALDPFAESARELCTWSILAEMQRSGLVEIGCHTVNHAVLANETEAAARAEMVDARDRIAAVLGRAPRHFAYPYGKPEQAGMREFALAREIGFASAVTTRKASLYAAHRAHLDALPRVEVSPNFESSAHYLRTVLTGLPLIYWNGGRRVVVD